MSRTWRVLVVDDDVTLADQAREALLTGEVVEAGDDLSIDVENGFEAAILRLGNTQYDVLVLDIKDDADAEDVEYAGLRVFSAVRAARFVPIVFFSLLPDQAPPAKPPFVSVVDKNAADSLGQLRSHVRDVLQSGLPTVHRALLDHVEAVTWTFMAEFVEPRWTDLTEPARKADLAHLLVRRLALSLDNGGEVLRDALSGSPGVQLGDEKVHPMRFYVVPPVGDWTLGDVIRGARPTITWQPNPTDEPLETDVKQEEDEEQAAAELDRPPHPNEPAWFVVVTPACDLVSSEGRKAKAEHVVVVECQPLQDSPEFQSWQQDPSQGNSKKLERLMSNNPQGRQAGRFMFLPGAWDLPDLLVDFQRVCRVPYGQLLAMDRRATLDSPYAEALLVSFNQHLGRVGTPDLDVTARIQELSNAVS